MSLEEWRYISEIYSNIAIGTATVIGIVVGYPVLRRWLRVRRIRKLYPLSRLGVDFKLADGDKSPGKIYIVDIKRKSRKWIESLSTFHDLNFYSDKVEHMSQNELDDYREEPGILTSGKRGH